MNRAAELEPEGLLQHVPRLPLALVRVQGRAVTGCDDVLERRQGSARLGAAHLERQRTSRRALDGSAFAVAENDRPFVERHIASSTLDVESLRDGRRVAQSIDPIDSSTTARSWVGFARSARYARAMPRALILGGTGAIGRATACRLLVAGWRVDLAGRNPARMPVDLAAAGATFTPVDRRDAAGIVAAVGDGTDLLVDCACFTAADAALLLPLVPHTGSTVMISSKAVYVDGAGHHPNSALPPRFDGPICETQATVRAGDADYTTREGYPANKVAAEHVLLESGGQVTVLRPSKIHGPGARRPREWVFVKRVLDRRPAVFLAHRGAGVDHTSAAANVAALIEVVAARPGRRILNSADPDAPSALEISRAVAQQLGHTREEVLLEAMLTTWAGIPGTRRTHRPGPGCGRRARLCAFGRLCGHGRRRDRLARRRRSRW